MNIRAFVSTIIIALSVVALFPIHVLAASKTQNNNMRVQEAPLDTKTASIGGQEIKFIQCPSGKFGDKQITEFYIMETEMTIEQYKSLCKVDNQLTTLVDLDDRFKQVRKKEFDIFLNQPADQKQDVEKEPVRFLKQDEIITIINIMNAKATLDLGLDTKQKKLQEENGNWTTSVVKLVFNVPTEIQWRRAAVLRADMDVCNEKITIKQICDCIIEDLKNDESDNIAVDKVKESILDCIKEIIRKAGNDSLSTVLKAKEGSLYKNIKIDGKHADSNNEKVIGFVNKLEQQKDQLMNYDPFIDENKDIHQFVPSDSCNYESMIANQLKKLVNETKEKNTKNKSNDKTICQGDDGTEYELSFDGLNEKIAEQITKRLVWDWRLRMRFRLWCIGEKGFNLDSDKDFKTMLSLYSFESSESEKKTLIYESIIYNIKHDEQNVESWKSLKPEGRKFYSVTFCRPNSAGLYGMFSNVAECIDSEVKDNGKTVYKIIGITAYKDFSKQSDMFFKIANENHKIKLFDCNDDSIKSNPVGIRLILIPGIDSDKFPAVFYAEFMKREDETQVINEANGLLEQFKNDSKYSENKDIVKGLENSVKEDNNDLFFKMLNSK